MKVLGTLMVGLFSFSVWAEDYLELYEKGATIIEMGNCTEGLSLIEEAMKVQSRGNIQKNYFPHYYLAICALENGDLEAAEKYAKQAQGSGITFSGKAGDFADFKKRLKEAKKQAENQLSLTILVHPSNPVSDLSLQQIREMYTGKKRTWEDGSKIIPVLGPRGSKENNFFLSQAGIKNEKDLADSVEFREMASMEEYVASTPGAIGFVVTGREATSAKTVRVNGKSSGEAGYALSKIKS